MIVFADHYSEAEHLTGQMFMLIHHMVSKESVSVELLRKFPESITYNPNCVQEVEISTWARRHLGSQTHTKA